MDDAFPLILLGQAAVFIFVAVAYGRSRKIAALQDLTTREQLDSKAFAETYFSDSPERGRIAVKLREILAANLELPLEGLRPDDGLETLLHAEMLASPDLFWDIERDFGAASPTADFEEWKAVVESLHTFRDLVDYVEQRQKQGWAEPPDLSMH